MFDLGNIGSGFDGVVSSLMVWAKFFGIVFACLLVVGIVFIVFWQMKKYPYKAVVMDIDKNGRIKNVTTNAKAGRIRKQTADGTCDYFKLKVQRQKINFNSPALVDEIHHGGRIGTLLLARFENDTVVPLVGEQVNKDNFELKVIPKEVAMQQMLTARDIDELTKIKKSLLLQIAPFMLIAIGFMIVGFFLLALLQQIGTLIEKIPSVPTAPIVQPTATPPPG